MPRFRREPRSVSWGPTRRAVSSVERVPAGAAALRGRVVDREPRLLERVDEIDRRLREVRDGHLVDHHSDTVLLADRVLLRGLVIEVHRVAEACTAAG